MKIYYVNIRGIKSKLESLRNIVEEEKPDIIGIAETMLDKTEDITIQGYKMIRNDRDKEGGGVLLAVKEEYRHVTMEVNRNSIVEESIWISMGTKQKYRIGLIYAPQETTTQKVKLEGMYKRIKKEIRIAKQKQENIFIMEDFNCKVGKLVKGNKEKVTKGGKFLIEMMEKEDIELVMQQKNVKGHGPDRKKKTNQ